MADGWYFAYTYMGPVDPMLENLRGDERFEKLMNGVRSNLDAQRARIEEMESASSDELDELFEE